MAVRYLKRRGYKILQQNYRTPIGEIDIIAKEKNTIAFVEVKTLSDRHFGSPKAAVTAKKQKKISMVALTYLKSIDQIDAKARFDVVAIESSPKNTQIELVKNAFELAYS